LTDFFTFLIKLFWENEFFRFLCIGGVNTLFGYGIFAIFIYLGLHYTVATFIATVIGVLFNFKTTGIFVFKSHDNWKIFGFISVYIITYLLNISIIFIFKKIGLNTYISGAIAILPVAVSGYILNKKFVFNKSSNLSDYTA